MVSTALMIVFIVISLLLAFAIGSNDETFASVVGVKRLSVRTAVIMGAVIAIIGGFLLSDNVGKTLREDISPTLEMTNTPILISIYVAMAISLILASVFGLPISSTVEQIASPPGTSWEKTTWSFVARQALVATLSR